MNPNFQPFLGPNVAYATAQAPQTSENRTVREFTPYIKMAAENPEGGLLRGRVLDLKRWAAIEAAENARKVAIEIEACDPKNVAPYTWAVFMADKASAAAQIAFAGANETVAAHLPDDIRYSEGRAKCYATLKAAADLADEGAAILREQLDIRKSADEKRKSH